MGKKFTLSFADDEEELYFYLKSLRRPSGFLKSCLESALLEENISINPVNITMKKISSTKKSIDEVDDDNSETTDNETKNTSENISDGSDTAETVELTEEEIYLANIKF